MKILIVGKDSFIGKSFIKKFRLLHDIQEVCVQHNKLENLSFIGYDAIIHLAAIVHSMSNLSKDIYFKVNSDLAFNVALKAKKEGVKHFIFFSTVKVFGESNSENTPWNETSDCMPETYYGQSKLDAENRIEKLNDETFVTTFIRPCLVYGEGVKANMLNLIKLTDRFPILPFGSINNFRSIVYLANLLDLVNELVKSSCSGVFIASDAKSISTTELCESIASALGKKRYLIKLPNIIQSVISLLKPNLYQSIWGTIIVNPESGYSKISFKPKFTTVEGIEAMVNWYKRRN